VQLIDINKFPVNEHMALITVPELSDTAVLYLADFRDTMALVYKPTNHFIGVTRSMQIRFAKRPFRMIGGIWFCDEDTENQLEHANIRLTTGLLSFGVFN